MKIQTRCLCPPKALVIRLGSEHALVDTQFMTQSPSFLLLHASVEMVILFEHIQLGLGDVAASPIYFMSYNINLLLTSNYRAFASRGDWRRLVWEI